MPPGFPRSTTSTACSSTLPTRAATPSARPPAGTIVASPGIERRNALPAATRFLLSQDAIRVDPQYQPLPLPGAGAMPGQFEPSRLHVLALSIERAW